MEAAIFFTQTPLHKNTVISREFAGFGSNKPVRALVKNVCLGLKMRNNFLLTRNSPILVTDQNVRVIFKWELFINQKVSLYLKKGMK